MNDIKKNKEPRELFFTYLNRITGYEMNKPHSYDSFKVFNDDLKSLYDAWRKWLLEEIQIQSKDGNQNRVPVEKVKKLEQLIQLFTPDIDLNLSYNLSYTCKGTIPFSSLENFSPFFHNISDNKYFSIEWKIILCDGNSPNDIEKNIEEKIKAKANLLVSLIKYDLLKTSEVGVLVALYEIIKLKDTNNIKEELVDIVSGHFNVRWVDIDKDYGNTDYFEINESVKIEEPKTTLRALVSNNDNSCIGKGIRVIPKSDTTKN